MNVGYKKFSKLENWLDDAIHHHICGRHDTTSYLPVLHIYNAGGTLKTGRVLEEGCYMPKEGRSLGNERNRKEMNMEEDKEWVRVYISPIYNNGNNPLLNVSNICNASAETISGGR